MDEPAVSATTKKLTGRYGVEHELGIEGGTVVTGRGRARANVYVDGGRIVEVTGSRAPSLQTIDASGLLVMPGMVDAHLSLIHISEPTRLGMISYAVFCLKKKKKKKQTKNTTK